MRKFCFLPILLLLAFLVACAGVEVKKWEDLTPKEKGAWMMNVYNKEFDDYKVIAAKPDLSEKAKDMLKIKKRVLMEVKPLISMYDGYLQTGIIPTDELETRIMSLLMDLLVIE